MSRDGVLNDIGEHPHAVRRNALCSIVYHVLASRDGVLRGIDALARLLLYGALRAIGGSRTF